MKKILFTIMAVVGFTGMITAQKQTNATMNPAPTKEMVAKDTKTKMQETNAKPTSAVESKVNNANNEAYRKAGLNNAQISDVSKAINDLDRKKAEIENSNSLTVEQKKNTLAAIEAERNIILKRKMGEASYKKYNEASQANKKIKTATPAN